MAAPDDDWVGHLAGLESAEERRAFLASRADLHGRPAVEHLSRELVRYALEDLRQAVRTLTDAGAEVVILDTVIASRRAALRIGRRDRTHMRTSVDACGRLTPKLSCGRASRPGM